MLHSEFVLQFLDVEEFDMQFLNVEEIDQKSGIWVLPLRTAVSWSVSVVD